MASENPLIRPGGPSALKPGLRVSLWEARRSEPNGKAGSAAADRIRATSNEPRLPQQLLLAFQSLTILAIHQQNPQPGATLANPASSTMVCSVLFSLRSRPCRRSIGRRAHRIARMELDSPGSGGIGQNPRQTAGRNTDATKL